MALAIATNFGRDGNNISSKLSAYDLRSSSATLWAPQLGNSQEVDRTLLFLVLKRAEARWLPPHWCGQ